MLKKLKYHKPLVVLSEKEEKREKKRLARKEEIQKERIIRQKKLQPFEYIRKYMEEKITLEELLKIFGDTPFGISTIFDKIVSSSFIKFLDGKIVYRFKFSPKEPIDLEVFKKIQNLVDYMEYKFGDYTNEIIEKDLYSAIKKGEYFLIEFLKEKQRKPILKKYKPGYIRIIYHRNG